MMISKILTAIEQYNMIKSGDKVTVALSGGADSVALLYALNSQKDNLNISLYAAHVNHNLRGDESKRDEEFVKKLCDSLGIPITVWSVDVKSAAKESNESIELAARRIRYELFSKLDTLIATAHTASDNLETVLFNISRGTGTDGLCGIPPVRDSIIRPLILCTRDDVVKYCNDNNLMFVTDSTNLTDDYTRNKIRHNVVPALKEINSAVEKNTVNSSRILRRENSYLDSIAGKELQKAQSNGELNVACLKKLDYVILCRVLRKFILNRTGITLNSTHTDQLVELIYKPSGKIDISSEYSIISANKKLYIEKKSDNVSFSAEISYLDKKGYEDAVKVNKLLSKCTVDCDKISGKLTVRTRMPGDSIKLAFGGTKSLKKLYNEYGIKEYLREKLPVACDFDGVVFVTGVGVAKRVCPDGNTTHYAVITVKQDK